MRDLRDRAWIVLPDLPAHGKSDPIPGASIQEYAEAFLPFLQAVHDQIPSGHSQPTGSLDSNGASSGQDIVEGSKTIDRPGGLILGGHSMGGAIALQIALTRPELLSGLVLVGSGAKLGVSSQILEGLVNAPQETQAVVARWSFTKNADPALILRTMRDLAGSPPERTLADFRACNAFDVRDRIAGIAQPTLLICGSEDVMTPPRYSTYMAERMPNARVHIVDGMGHAVMIEAAKEVSEAIASFAEEIEKDRSGRTTER